MTDTHTTLPSSPASFVLGRLKSFAVRWRRVLLAALGAWLLFGAIGYLWLPGFIKQKAEAALSEKFHRPVSIDRIDVSPYTLAVTVEGFRIGQRADQGAEPLLAFDSLYVNASTASLFRLAPVISAVKLVKPQIHLGRGSDGQLSIADLIEDFLNQPESEPARFSVSNIEVTQGSITFEDKFKGSTQRVSELHLGVPFVANFESAEDVWVEPLFSARLNEGAPIEIKGRALPFADRREIVADLELDGFDLTGIDEYVPLQKGLKLLAGKLDSKLAVSFVQAPRLAPVIRLNGEVALRELSVKNTSSLDWTLQAQRLALALKDADIQFKSPLHAGVTGESVRIKQGSHPEMLISQLALADVELDPAASQGKFLLTAEIAANVAKQGAKAPPGSLRVQGQVGWAPLKADIEAEIRDFDLVPVQGFMSDRLNATLTRGAAHFLGKVQVKPPVANGGLLQVQVSGDARLTDMNLLDPEGSQDWLRWRSLDVEGIQVATSPMDVNIAKISLADFFGRVVISPEGKLNLKQLMKPAPDAAEQKPTPEVQPAEPISTENKPASVPVENPGQATPIQIGQILLQGGRLDFNDRFVKPNYRVNLTGLAGKVGPLVPGKPGLVDVKGAIDRSAPLQILGRVDPFGAELALDITAKAKGIDLPSFSPYSGKYVGYAIEKGKLSVDVHYLIDRGQLTAENNIFLDQLTFGAKIESADAMSVPVNLAVALLRNSRGEIDINLPITGSLRDPEFSIGSIVVKVFVNLIVKAVTSPFALLGSLFGSGADLSQIDFAPGYARFTPEGDKRIEAVAKAMNERPGLKLEITGVADAANDREGLKRAVLERRVKAQKLADQARQGQSGGSLSEVEVSAAEYPKYLELAYKNEKFEKPRNLIGLNKSLPVPEMEQLMLANLPAGEEELRNLAERRARSAREYLLGKGIPPERIFVLQPRVEAQADGKALAARIELSLR